MLNKNLSALFAANFLAISVSAITSPAYAQSSNTEMMSGSGADSDSFVLEEVMVTARRKQEDLQSVPVSVVALTSQALLEASITSFTDLQQNVPGVFFCGQWRRQQSCVRDSRSVQGFVGHVVPGCCKLFCRSAAALVG